MTYQELVKKVQTALAKADASQIAEHIAVQINVTGDAEGIFYVEVAEGVLYVEPYDYNDRDAQLTGDAKVVLAVAQGKTSVEAAIADGSLAHEGNYDKVLALGSTIPAKKAAAKKAADTAEEKPKRTRKTAAKKAEDAAVEEKPKRTRKTAAKKAEDAAAEEKPKRTRKTAAKKADK